VFSIGRFGCWFNLKWNECALDWRIFRPLGRGAKPEALPIECVLCEERRDEAASLGL
jgi:hypothetical protein